MEFKGDILIGRTGTASRRINTGASAETITTTRNIHNHDYQWLRLSNASTQDIILPDATGILLGWDIVIDVPSTSGASINVKTYDESVPVLLKNILAGRAYRLTCVDISSAAGLWNIDWLEEADLIPSERYVTTFNATTDWGTASAGYYTITVNESTHLRGAQPNVQIEELSGSDYIECKPDQIYKYANGNVSFRVPEVPDLRFAGRIIFI